MFTGKFKPEELEKALRKSCNSEIALACKRRDIAQDAANEAQAEMTKLQDLNEQIARPAYRAHFIKLRPHIFENCKEHQRYERNFFPDVNREYANRCWIIYKKRKGVES